MDETKSDGSTKRSAPKLDPLSSSSSSSSSLLSISSTDNKNDEIDSLSMNNFLPLLVPTQTEVHDSVQAIERCMNRNEGLGMLQKNNGFPIYGKIKEAAMSLAGDNEVISAIRKNEGFQTMLRALIIEITAITCSNNVCNSALNSGFLMMGSLKSTTESNNTTPTGGTNLTDYLISIILNMLFGKMTSLVLQICGALSSLVFKALGWPVHSGFNNTESFDSNNNEDFGFSIPQFILQVILMVIIILVIVVIMRA